MPAEALTIVRGSVATLQATIDAGAVNITGWTFRSHLRRKADDPTVYAELTTANGGIEIVTAAAGVIKVVYDDDITKKLFVGEYVMDVFRETPTPRMRVLARPVVVEEAVTR